VILFVDAVGVILTSEHGNKGTGGVARRCLYIMQGRQTTNFQVCTNDSCVYDVAI
jgi:hypothetical protein